MVMMIDECGLDLEQDAMLRQGSTSPHGLGMLASPQKSSQTQGTAKPLQGPQLRGQMRGMANGVPVHDLPP